MNLDTRLRGYDIIRERMFCVSMDLMWAINWLLHQIFCWQISLIVVDKKLKIERIVRYRTKAQLGFRVG